MDAVAELQELERRDEELAAATDRLRSVQEEVARIRTRAEGIEGPRSASLVVASGTVLQ